MHARKAELLVATVTNRERETARTHSNRQRTRNDRESEKMKDSISNNRSSTRVGATRATQSSTGRAMRRDGKGAGKSSAGFKLRSLKPWLPLASKVFFACCVVALVVVGYRAVAAASMFRADAIDVTGVERASAERITQIVKRKAATSNVWQLDLEALSSELGKEPWVRTAIVSRVLPSGLRVRVTEREPRVVIRTGAGQLMWVDEDAVQLARVEPTDDLPPFFLRGFDETLTTSAQTENRRRIAEAMKMIGEWRERKVVERVSEVNVDDLRDVRAQLSGRDAEVEVRLGANNYGMRLVKALEVLDEKRDVVRENRGGKIVRLDATLVPKPIIVGVSNQPSVSEHTAQAALTPESGNPKTPPPAQRATVRANEAKPAQNLTTLRDNVRNLARGVATKPEQKTEAERKAEKREVEKREEAKRETAKRVFAAKRDAAKRRPNTEPSVATAQRLRRVG
jgi:cell division protein FtsQ